MSNRSTLSWSPWQGALLRLVDQVGKLRLEAACTRALHFGDVRYRRIKEILNAALDQQPLPSVATPTVRTVTFAFERRAVEFFGLAAD